MRILHVVNDANTGGAQTLIESLALHADPHDEVHVVVLMDQGVLSTRLERAATSVAYFGISRRSINFIRPVVRLKRLIRDLDVDIVHSHLLQSDLVCLLTAPKVPVISTLHTSGSHESNRVSRAVSKLVARLSKRFSSVVACTPAAKDYGERMGYSMAASMPVIVNGSKVPDFVPGSVSPARFLSLSRWHPMKDHETLFRAFSIFASTQPEWQLVCAGNEMDDENEELTRLISESGLESRVQLLGPVSDVAALLGSVSALVISSSHGEALPMAGIEALAFGVPVVTTDVGDCSALAVSPELLVSPRTPLDLASALTHIASSPPAEFARMRRDAWTNAKSNFDVAVTADGYRNLYRNLLAE